MNYYSTNGKAPQADLKKAVVKGLAEDRGLYMPERIEKLPKAFFDEMKNMSFQDIAYNVASNFFGEDVDAVVRLSHRKGRRQHLCLGVIPRSYPRLQGCRCPLYGAPAAVFP